jgi:hypothetical protein
MSTAAWSSCARGAPDYTTVNLSEEGATEVMEALIDAGIGIEAGV